MITFTISPSYLCRSYRWQKATYYRLKNWTLNIVCEWVFCEILSTHNINAKNFI